MRVAVIATAVGATVVSGGGERMGCLGGSADPIEVSWSLPSGPGASGVQLLGCEHWQVSAEVSSGRLDAVPGWGDCAVQGWRQDGQLRVESTPVHLDPRAHDVFVDFDLPAGPIAGIGARLHSTGGWGIRVDEVLPGYPAERAGLAAGALIVEVDGMPTHRMSTSHFVRVVTGSPGTDVAVTTDEGVAHTLTRERIPD